MSLPSHYFRLTTSVSLSHRAHLTHNIGSDSALPIISALTSSMGTERTQYGKSGVYNLPGNLFQSSYGPVFFFLRDLSSLAWCLFLWLWPNLKQKVRTMTLKWHAHRNVFLMAMSKTYGQKQFHIFIALVRVFQPWKLVAMFYVHAENYTHQNWTPIYQYVTLSFGACASRQT